jgi:hypothetical protein
MNQTGNSMKDQRSADSLAKVALNLEVHIIPVSDVERSKQFYQRLGWRLDEDVSPAKSVRIVQFTPPGSGCSDASVEGTIGIGAIPNGFGIEAELRVSLPGLPRHAAEALVEKAHVVCPYSNATRGNIDVRLTVL